MRIAGIFAVHAAFSIRSAWHWVIGEPRCCPRGQDIGRIFAYIANHRATIRHSANAFADDFKIGDQCAHFGGGTKIKFHAFIHVERLIDIIGLQRVFCCCRRTFIQHHAPFNFLGIIVGIEQTKTVKSYGFQKFRDRPFFSENPRFFVRVLIQRCLRATDRAGLLRKVSSAPAC